MKWFVSFFLSIKTLIPSANIDSGHDLVELSGCNLKTFWEFPKYITKCPNRSCHQEFGDYTATLLHYRLTHAKNEYYCNLCCGPIIVTTLYKLQRHFIDKHPDYKPSNIFGKKCSSTLTSSTTQKKVCKFLIELNSNTNLICFFLKI